MKPLATCCLLFLLACQPQQAPMELSESEISAVMEATTQYGTAIVGGDFEKLRSLMDPDIMLMPPTASAIQGVDASIQYMQSGPPMEGSISAERIFGSGNQAYVRGNFNLTVNVNDSTQIENNGKFVEVWEKRNDGWKVVIDIWNSNAAADM